MADKEHHRTHIRVSEIWEEFGFTYASHDDAITGGLKGVEYSNVDRGLLARVAIGLERIADCLEEPEKRKAQRESQIEWARDRAVCEKLRELFDENVYGVPKHSIVRQKVTELVRNLVRKEFHWEFEEEHDATLARCREILHQMQLPETLPHSQPKTNAKYQEWRTGEKLPLPE